ncbi:hypothetical protein [Prevotella falsenii]|uniref:hypothetical protein n=1 Tax=Prevotella falsenii TaxID=515414 RepID=UPI0004692860|nr:hypothetical protein [Prevotella falsenii]
MKLKNRFANLAEERISQRVLYVLTGIAALIFVLFFSVGFYVPLAENPAFNAPLLTDALIVFMWILFGLTVLVMLLSVFHTVKTISVKQRVVNGIPTYRITTVVFGTTFVCLVLSFVFGSSDSMVINGATYADKFWLKASDMFVTSSLVLLLAAIGVTVFGATRYYRKRK